MLFLLQLNQEFLMLQALHRRFLALLSTCLYLALELQILAHFVVTAFATATAYMVQNFNTQFTAIFGLDKCSLKAAKLVTVWATELLHTLVRQQLA